MFILLDLWLLYTCWLIAFNPHFSSYKGLCSHILFSIDSKSWRCTKAEPHYIYQGNKFLKDRNTIFKCQSFLSTPDPLTCAISAAMHGEAAQTIDLCIGFSIMSKLYITLNEDRPKHENQPEILLALGQLLCGSADWRASGLGLMDMKGPWYHSRWEC